VEKKKFSPLLALQKGGSCARIHGDFSGMNQRRFLHNPAVSDFFPLLVNG